VAAVFQRVGHYRELETASDELSCAVFEQALANTTQIGVEITHMSGECEALAGEPKPLWSVFTIGRRTVGTKTQKRFLVV